MDTPRPEDEVVDKLYERDEITRAAHKQDLREAMTTFVISCVLLVAGAGLIFWGALTSDTNLQRAKLGAGAMISIIGGAVLKLHKSAHDRIQEGQKNEHIDRMVRQITDPAERNKAIQEHLADVKKKSFWKRITGG